MCDIEILAVTGLDQNGDSVGVVGRVSDCPEPLEGAWVTVTISCGGNEDEQVAQVFSDGRWFIKFTGVSCRCLQPVTVVARCETDPTCEPATLQIEELECIACLDVSIGDGSDDVTPPVGIRCLTDRDALVTFNYTVTNTLPFIVFITVECGPLGTGISGTNTGITPAVTPADIFTETVQCKFPTPSSPQIVLWFSRFNGTPLACPPLVVEVPRIEQCPCQQTDLPRVTVAVNECLATFQRGEFEGDCDFIWNFGDNSPNVTRNTPTVTHVYPANDTYNAGVTMECGNCTYPLSVEAAEITNCRGVIVGVDDDDDYDDGGDSNPWFCGALRALVGVAAAIAVFALVMIICVPAAWYPLLIAAGISAGLSIVAGILVAIFCPNRPCKYWLLSTAQATIAGGSALISFSACCFWVLYTGIGTIIGGILMMAWWKSDCVASNCTAAKETAWAVTVLTPALTGVFFAIPILQACHAPWADLVLGVLFAGLVAFALGCIDD